MEKEINIAEILKDMPRGTNLYSPICGECKFDKIVKELGEDVIFVTSATIQCHSFFTDGKYSVKGECMLFPSREMRDWSKLAWKRGDILLYSHEKTNIYVIFDRFIDSSYQGFISQFYCWKADGEIQTIEKKEEFLSTLSFEKVTNKEFVNAYIKDIEERFGGKLNMETLEIEKKPEFKEGDIVTVNENRNKWICVFKGLEKKNSPSHTYLERFISYNTNLDVVDWHCGIINILARTVRFATEEEKQQLFEALAKEGKRWNAETKQIENIKPKWTPKPFDRVLVRDSDNLAWKCDIYSHYKDKGLHYVCVGSMYNQCIPYNEETAKLIGTTNAYKEE